MFEKNDQISELRSQIANLTEQLTAMEAEAQKFALERLEDIRISIRELVDEAEQRAREANVAFYRETFVQGIDRETNGSGMFGQAYWESSAYC